MDTLGQFKDPQIILKDIKVKAEPYVSTDDARLTAAIVETELYQQLKEQTEQLELFKKKVNERLRKQKHKTIVEEDHKVVIEKHDTKPPKRNEIPNGHDHEVKIINCSEDINRGVKILSSFCDKETLDIVKKQQSTISLKPVQYRQPHDIKPSSIGKLASVQKVVTLKPVHTLSENEQKLMERKEIAAHNLAVRRMYSALERQQSRVNAHNREQHIAAERRKNEREKERKQLEMMYAEENQSNDCSDEKEQAKQWLEMVALQRRHQKLVKQKETERYCEALKFQLHEKYPDLPTLCSCHSTIWEADPINCARNCPYFNNYKRFAKDLSSLFRSVSTTTK